MNTNSDSLVIDFDKVYAAPGEEYLPFQKWAIQEMILRQNVLLADEMGLGKTIQVIGYINIVKPESVLVVCPNSLRLNWSSEIKRWMEPGLLESYGEIETCTPSLYIPGSKFVICSFEGLTRWHPVLKEVKWDLFVIDEAHCIKNRSAQRTRAAYAMNEQTNKKFLLTGSPIPNYPHELEPLVHLLDKEQWPTRSLDRYYRRGSNGYYGYHLAELQKLLREGVPKRVTKTVTRVVPTRVAVTQSTLYECDNENCRQVFEYVVAAERHVSETSHSVAIRREATERIVPIQTEEVEQTVTEPGIGLMIRRLKKEVLPELPRKRRQIIEIPAEGELERLVKTERELLEKQVGLLDELDEALGLKKVEEAETDLSFEAIIERLHHSRRYFFEEIALIRHQLALAKAPYVIEFLENNLENRDKVVCFAHHQDVCEALLKHFKDKAVLVYGPTSIQDRQDRIEHFWKDEACSLFVASLKIGGLGINLQVAANVVFAEIDWVPGTITQAEDRCHRIGQEASLLIQHLVVEGSMDAYMAKKIVQKQKTIRQVLDR